MQLIPYNAKITAWHLILNQLTIVLLSQVFTLQWKSLNRNNHIFPLCSSLILWRNSCLCNWRSYPVVTEYMSARGRWFILHHSKRIVTPLKSKSMVIKIKISHNTLRFIIIYWIYALYILIQFFSESVIEEQPLPIINNTALPANQSCPDRSPFIQDVVMRAVCGALLVYSLSISWITIVIWVRMKNGLI